MCDKLTELARQVAERDMVVEATNEKLRQQMALLANKVWVCWR